MPMGTAQQIAQKWASAMNGASQAYKDGIARVTENPMAKAAANVAGYLAGVQDAANSGRWQAGLNRMTKDQWQQLAINLGSMRIGPGATAAQPKMERFLTAFLPVLANNVATVRAMPNQTYEQRKARALAMMDLNHQFTRS